MRNTGIFKDLLFTEHDPGFDHVERPERLLALYEVLDSLSLQNQFVQPKFSPVDQKVIGMNHTDAHIERVRATAGKIYSVLSDDTFTSNKSYDAACLAVGAVKNGIDFVVSGELDNGFALVRPPGHHAEKSEPMGFCLFNNIAIGAHHALENLGLNRIMIVDWDVHHGNGTQDAFYTTDQVLFISIHQSPLYPGSGFIQEVGFGEGEGYTINIPLPGGQGDLEYANIFNTIIKPIGYQYKPDLILISAGFDGYFSDTLSSVNLTNRGFGYMTRVLVEMALDLCDGNIFVTLEGGYDITGLKEGVFTVLSELSGTCVKTDFPSSLDEQTLQRFRDEKSLHPAVEMVRDVAKKYWNL